MDRLKELDIIEEGCTEWIKANKNAAYPMILSVYEMRLKAVKEKTEIYSQQFKNLTNGKNN